MSTAASRSIASCARSTAAPPINPDIITAQMEGGIGFGLGAVLYGAITLKDGRVEQRQFQRLSGAAHERNAEGRSVHRALDRGADRRGRTGRGAGRAGRRQCDLRRHRQAHAHVCRFRRPKLPRSSAP